jgi:hypothetical protein
VREEISTQQLFRFVLRYEIEGNHALISIERERERFLCIF